MTNSIREISTEPDNWSVLLFTLAALRTAVRRGKADVILRSALHALATREAITHCALCNEACFDDEQPTHGLFVGKGKFAAFIPHMFTLCGRCERTDPDPLELALLHKFNTWMDRATAGTGNPDWRLVTSDDGRNFETKPLIKDKPGDGRH